VVVAAFFILVLMMGTFSTFGIFFKPMLTELVWNRAETSLALLLSWIITGLVGIVAGRVNDKYGPRIVVTVCGFIFGLGYLLMSQVYALWQLYLFYAVLIGIGMSGTFIPLTSTVAKWFVKRRTSMTGIILAGMSVGVLGAAPVANWLISLYEWRLSYIILGSITLVVVVLLAQLLRRDPTQMGQVPYGKDKEETGLKLNTEVVSLRKAAASRQFWLISSMLLILGFCLTTIVAHIAPHATDLGFSTTSAANILATVGGAGVFGRILLGIAGDRIGNRQIFIIGFALMAAALFWLVLAKEELALYLFAAVFGFASSGCVISQSPLIAELFGLSSHGLILGVINFGFAIGSAIGPFLAGYIFDFDNSYQTAFVVCAAISIIGVILTVLLKPTKTS
jgi:MFS family permease